MRCGALLAAAAGAAGAGAALVDVDLSAAADGLEYDGHGALSAGASSRLLFDYAEPYRSQILDYLFKPKFGASLHFLKVEIGGDTQSTDGTEASHMHRRDDLDCTRGYEFWLLEEARKRNPKIATWGLSWGMPAWVGNDSYFTNESIDYHVNWLKCVKDKHPAVGDIDYMGVWNERPWGNPTWVKDFRAAMDKEGFHAKINIPDGGFQQQILTDMDSDPEFKDAVDGIGLHYPCNKPHPDVQYKYGKKYWSSEDYSTVGNWAGGGCWGRILNQNFVRMNMTSTISWSLIWSVYDDWPYFGNGLMYAMHPWSGYYEVGSPIWTSAHTEQFTEVGWRYVPGGSGTLGGGGSYVTLASPDGQDVTVVLEKLEGRCLRCAGQTTTAEDVAVKISGGPRGHTTLAHWVTTACTGATADCQSSWFQQAADVAVDAGGQFKVTVPKDGIVTVSSVQGARHGNFSVPIPANTEFPTPYRDDFESRPVGSFARYLADNGGTFEVARDPAAGGQGLVLAQVVSQPPKGNAWGRNVEPVTVFGEKTWADAAISARVYLAGAPTPAPGPPAPASAFHAVQSVFNEQCLDVKGKGGAGTAVDTWTCVSDYNEQFAYDPQTGAVTEKQTGLCLSAKCASAGLCIAACDKSADQAWAFTGTEEEAGTLTLRSSAACVSVASKNLDAPLAVDTCTGADGEKWKFFTGGGGGEYAGVCQKTNGGGGGQKGPGLCLVLYSTGQWTVGPRGGGALASGTISGAIGAWHNISLTTQGGKAAAHIDGREVASGVASSGAGRLALVSGWNLAWFDDLAVRKL